jgi:hypothetical protein
MEKLCPMSLAQLIGHHIIYVGDRDLVNLGHSTRLLDQKKWKNYMYKLNGKMKKWRG